MVSETLRDRRHDPHFLPRRRPALQQHFRLRRRRPERSARRSSAIRPIAASSRPATTAACSARSAAVLPETRAVTGTRRSRSTHTRTYARSACAATASPTFPAATAPPAPSLNDNSEHTIIYQIQESLGFVGWGYGVEWCVVGFDPRHAYSPACSSLRPVPGAQSGRTGAARKLLSAASKPGEAPMRLRNLFVALLGLAAAAASPALAGDVPANLVATTRFRFLCAHAVLVARLLRHRRRGEVPGSMRDRLRPGLRRARPLAGQSQSARSPGLRRRRLHPGRGAARDARRSIPPRGWRATNIASTEPAPA